MRRPSYIAVAAAVVLSAASGAGCHYQVAIDRKPGAAPRCTDGVCLEVVTFYTNRKTVGVWMHAPPSTRLINARVAAGDSPACQGRFPTEWVDVDGDLHRQGPVDVSGGHGLVFGFPANTWMSHADRFFDVELDVAGAPRCVRARLTNAEGRVAVGS
ncbi:MAG TPA: hypothetical protein VKQ32_17985 [Polyangia bacterium]|nr:hypothetical protein [Polyangia bacterium]